MKKLLLIIILLFSVVSNAYSKNLTTKPSNEDHLLSKMPHSDVITLIDNQQLIKSPHYQTLLRISGDLSGKKYPNINLILTLAKLIDPSLYPVIAGFTKFAITKDSAANPKISLLFRQKLLDALKSQDITQLKEMAFGVNLTTNTLYFIAKGNFDEEEMFRIFLSGKDPLAVVFETYKDHLYFLMKNGEYNVLAITFLDNETLAFSTFEGIKKIIDVKNKSLPNTFSNPLMVDAVKTQTNKVISFIGIKPQLLKAEESVLKLPPDIEQIEAIILGFELKSEFVLNATLAFSSEKVANNIKTGLIETFTRAKKEIANEAEKNANQTKLLTVLNQVMITSDAKEVKVSASLSSELSNELLLMTKLFFQD